MSPDSTSFTPLNLPPDAVPQCMDSFALSASPCTDLWRKPPASDTSTAPILYTSLRHPFVSAEVTVNADWRLEWDQAGLVIFAGQPPGRPNAARRTSTQNQTQTQTQPHPPQSQTPSSDPSSPQQRPRPSSPPPPYSHQQQPAPASKWVKVGLEYHNNVPSCSSVCATSEGADWVITSLPPYQSRRSDLRVKLERIGYALWVYYEDQMLGWKKLREVTWFFWGVEDKAVRVGVYLSRPANWPLLEQGSSSNAGRDLLVEFEGLEIF